MQTSRWPISKLPIRHIEPFPYHKGELYVELLDRLAKYVTDQLHPNLRKTIEELVEELEQVLALQHNKYVEGVQDFQRIHDAFMEDVNSALMALNDNAVADLVDDPASALGTTLRALFPDKAGFDILTQELEAAQQQVMDRVERTPESTVQDTTIWVTRSGDDAQDGATENTAVATLARAVDLIPDVIHRGHIVTITLGIGEWDEDFRVANKTVHGELILQGSTADPTLHRVRRIEGDTITGNLKVHYLESTLQGINAIRFYRCSYVHAYRLRNIDATASTTSGNVGLLSDEGSNVFAEECHFTGKRYALRANYLAKLFSRNNTGDNNEYGIGARWGGHVSLFGTQPTGRAANQDATSGGLIVESDGSKIGREYNTQFAGHNVESQHETLTERYPVRSWVFRQSSGGFGFHDIPVGGTLRLKFQRDSIDSPFVAEAHMAYTALTTTGTRSAKTLFTGRMREDQIANYRQDYLGGTIGGGGNPDTIVTMTHSGQDGIFYLDLTPTPGDGARAGWYGVDFTYRNMRDYNAPTFLGSEILEG